MALVVPLFDHFVAPLYHGVTLLHNTIISMASLPLEILQEIFKHAHHSVTLEEWNKVELTNLRLVSSQWDAAAETCPALWTSILVTEKSAIEAIACYKESSLPEPCILLPSTALRLHRSGCLPLNIVIHFPYAPHHYLMRPYDDHYFGHSHALVLSTLLHANSRRIASLETHGETNALKRNALKYLSQRIMPLLYRFVDVGVTDPELGGSPNFQFFGEPNDLTGHLAILQYPHCRTAPCQGTIGDWGKTTYPALEELDVCGTSYDWDLFPSIQRLRRLSLRNQPHSHRPPPRTLLAMLSASAHTLQHLELTDVIYLNLHLSPLIVLEQLRSLTIGYRQVHEPVLLFSFISTPALTELSLIRDPRGHSSDSDGYHSQLIKILIRKLPLQKLQKLNLDGVVFPTRSRYKIRTPANTGDLSLETYTYWRELGVPDLPEHAATYMLFVFFLRQFSNLRHLEIHKVEGADLGDMAEWTACLPMLESLHVDVVGDELGDGFVAFLDILTAERLAVRKELQVTVGEWLASSFGFGEEDLV